MKLGYFPGCSLHGTSREFDESVQAVAGPLGIELDELDDWSCCGATSGHATNHLLGVALAARNLAIAEEQGHAEVLAPCAACFNRLASARHETAKDPVLFEHLRKVLARPFSNTVAVRNIADVLRASTATIKAKATAPLKDLKLACYYGCLLVRPGDVCGFDDPEDPRSMEEVVSACGATPVAWSRRLDCCGGGFSMSRTASVLRLGRAIVDDARKAGADAIVVACPMCHSNLDFRQKAMGGSPMPILFLTQVVGLALGVGGRELGIGRHFVPAGGVVERVRAGAPAAATAAGEVG
jgi:heterodisulfide reductase subunit B